MSENGISLEQLVLINPWMNNDCSAIYDEIDPYQWRSICIGVGDSASYSTTAPPTATPTDTAPGCSDYYTVIDGDSCAIVLDLNDITFTQFYAWNPSVGDNCQHLQLGIAYCVGLPAASTSSPISTSTSTSSTTSSAPSTSSTSAGVAPPGPTQAGVATKCTSYVLQKDGVYCYDMAAVAGITLDDLYKWNPGLNGDCSGLWPGYAYCAAAPSGPTQDGMVVGCTKYAMQKDDVFCYDMAAAAGITLDDLYRWNPALNGDCSGLWPGYSYCVGAS